MIVELVKKAKKGNKEAFTELILYIQQDLYKIAKTKLDQEADIYDAVQETIISAYNSIEKLSDCSKFKSWIFKILINKCNDIYRNQTTHNNISFEANECEKYLSDCVLFDTNVDFENLLNLLNDDEKTIVLLYYVEGYTSKEIAHILGIKDTTVRSKILRAKKRIEENLKEVL